MIDKHLTLLRLIAKRAGGALNEHDGSERSADATRMDRRKRLERISRRAARQLAKAEARRLKRPKAQGS